MGTRKARSPHPFYPLVLVHGLLGFGTIGPRGDLEYFRGVMRHLENNRDVLDGKAKVYVADVDPLDSIPSRAIQLRDFIQDRVLYRGTKRRYEKVNIIAHSMGGLDARYMIANLAMDTGPRDPMAARVASLTTIGTPHLGTPFADFMIELPVGQRIVQWANFYSVNVAAFEQLTERFLVEQGFNERMPDRGQVEYFSYAGDVLPSRVFPFMLLPAQIIWRSGKRDVRNDGLVPVDSATFRYGPVGKAYDQVLPADHATQIGHGYGHLRFGPQRRFRHLDFFAHLANALCRRGLYFCDESAVKRYGGTQRSRRAAASSSRAAPPA